MTLRKKYTVVENYFDDWSQNMAYVLGFIVADGNIQKCGYYLKVEIHPRDLAVLEFIRNQISPDYEIKYPKGRSIARIYPACKTWKTRLAQLGVVPAKTGKETIPEEMPEIFLWDFIRGYFDGDGSVSDTSVRMTCNSKNFIDNIRERTSLGYVATDRMNHLWIVEDKKHVNTLYSNFYRPKSFFLTRKKDRMEWLVKTNFKKGRFKTDEDDFLRTHQGIMKRFEMAQHLGRNGTSIKNRLAKLRLGGGLSAE